MTSLDGCLQDSSQLSSAVSGLQFLLVRSCLDLVVECIDHPIGGFLWSALGVSSGTGNVMEMTSVPLVWAATSRSRRQSLSPSEDTNTARQRAQPGEGK